MAYINENFALLENNYLFAEVSKRIAAQREAGQKDIISLGIGDVTEALCPAVIAALHAAVEEMANPATFHGYGPYEGYPFLRDLIAQEEYASRNASVAADEIFVSDGAKSDMAQILALFGPGNRIGIPDPVYPVYLDSNVLSGNKANITLLPCRPEAGFLPEIPREKLDIIYLCFPNNPTGVTMDRARLSAWVEYARKHHAVILYDGAYESFIQDPSTPRSIYEVEGAREVAIEFRSYSKKAGFTGTRLGYCVIPKTLKAYGKKGDVQTLNPLWMRHQATSYNGAPYIIQKAAAAVYSQEGKEQIQAATAYYLENASLLRSALASFGYTVYGGQNAPYVWFDTAMDSWDFFDLLLKTAGVAGTPGVGFGQCGAGFFRLTAFNSREKTEEAIARMAKLV